MTPKTPTRPGAPGRGNHFPIKAEVYDRAASKVGPLPNLAAAFRDAVMSNA